MTLSDPAVDRTAGRRRAGLVWGTAAAAYAVAVLHRSSLGVAGLEASERFGAGAAGLATFVVVQLVVYAGLQVPVGLLLDRLGPRRLIASGAVLMGIGQLVMALASDVRLALVARVLIGTGDALTFVSVIRLLPAWFPLRRVPLLTQVTGVVGMSGQVLAAVALVPVLHGGGWPTAFVTAAVVGVVVGAAVAVVVRDAPGPDRRRGAAGSPAPGVAAAPAPVRPRTRRALGAVLREPGTWLGFWVHFVGGSSINAMVLLWASPFLRSAEGRSPAEVSSLLSLTAVVALVAGPPIGHLTGRRPERRLAVVGVVAAAIGLAWAGLLLPPRPLPLWALALFMAVIAVGGPTSLVGLDVARAHNPRERMGTATGVANAGAFVGALLTMSAVGLVLDARGGAGVAAPLSDYRVALATAGGTWLLGVVGLVLAARRVTAGRSRPASPPPPPPAVPRPHADGVVDALVAGRAPAAAGPSSGRR
ncbi:MFS transporter [Cellulomonas aerilata]|uniref:MFS transporter n=1 Tax=Cellulomonas aerilata TaxID=515326 RepID=A0A512D9N2_9CELL|nr:MFS transporter [Cellulomonas aerilata]GEO33179.1 MFS transporter [Cellulomonas aerilata]